MSIRLLLLLGAVLLVAGGGEARAQAAPTPPAEGASAPAAPLVLTQTTAVHGAPPDLNGRWLVLFDMAAAQVSRTLPFLLEIQSRNGTPEIVEHFVKLPPELSSELEKHNAARTKWEPTAAELSLLASKWATLPEGERGVTEVTTDLWTPAAFEDAESQKLDVKGALWIIREIYKFEPGGRRPVTQVNAFMAAAPAGSGWTGNAEVAQVIAAPFTVPISLKGTFRMLRVEEESRGLLARLLDAFKGCRR